MRYFTRPRSETNQSFTLVSLLCNLLHVYSTVLPDLFSSSPAPLARAIPWSLFTRRLCHEKKKKKKTQHSHFLIQYATVNDVVEMFEILILSAKRKKPSPSVYIACFCKYHENYNIERSDTLWRHTFTQFGNILILLLFSCFLHISTNKFTAKNRSFAAFTPLTRILNFYINIEQIYIKRKKSHN